MPPKVLNLFTHTPGYMQALAMSAISVVRVLVQISVLGGLVQPLVAQRALIPVLTFLRFARLKTDELIFLGKHLCFLNFFYITP
jgi:hypothetical protein